MKAFSYGFGLTTFLMNSALYLALRDGKTHGYIQLGLAIIGAGFVVNGVIMSLREGKL